MPRNKLKDKNIRKLTRVGQGSISLTIPIEILRELRWREKQKVRVRRYAKKIIIEDWKK